MLLNKKKITITVATLIAGVLTPLIAQLGLEGVATPEQIQEFIEAALTGGAASALSYLGIQAKADTLGYVKSALKSKRFWTTAVYALSLPGAAIAATSFGVPIATATLFIKGVAYLATGANLGIGSHDIVQLIKANTKAFAKGGVIVR